MMMRAQITREELQRAFDDYAEYHGRDRAIAALEASTGAKTVADVPQAKIILGMVELVAKFSFVGRAGKSSASTADKATTLHEALARIGADAFARMRDVAAK